MTNPRFAKRQDRDDSGLTAIELLIAAILLVVVVTIGFLVTTAMVGQANATQRTGSLTGPAQNGMQVLREFFAGAVPAQSVVAPSGTPGSQLYADGCANGSGGAAFPTGQGPFVSATGTDVVLCLVRSGANSAYTYHVYFSGSTCATTGNCTLTVDQDPPLTVWAAPSTPKPTAVGTPTTVEQIPNVVCTQCITASPTGALPFVFSNTSVALNSVGSPTVPTASLSQIQAVDVTLTIASSANHAGSTATDTLTGRVFMPNALGGPI